MANPSGFSSFASFGLSNWLVKSCELMQIYKPTKIQELSISAVLKGKDVIGSSKTGSGKTACFALPLLQKLNEDPFGVFALVITPVRELAYQICDQFVAFGGPINVDVAVCVGGKDMTTQVHKLLERPHVVIATPGRLAEIMRGDETVRKAFKNLQALVIDEADRVLDEVFEDDLGEILSSLPSAGNRQTLLFTATVNDAIMDLQEQMGGQEKMPIFRADHEEGQVPVVDRLTHEYIHCKALPSVLLTFLHHLLTEKHPDSKAIVFAGTIRDTQVISNALQKLEIEATPLHALLEQNRRMASLGKFRDGRSRVLVTTDVAARGLDIPMVDLVVNLDLPREPEDYIHRVGRTARAGRKGLAISFVTEKNAKLVKAVEEYASIELAKCPLNEEKVLKKLSRCTKAMKESEIALNDAGFDDKLKKRKGFQDAAKAAKKLRNK